MNDANFQRSVGPIESTRDVPPSELWGALKLAFAALSPMIAKSDIHAFAAWDTDNFHLF